MEKRHQNPDVLDFELFIDRQTHVLAQINKRAQNSSKNGLEGSKMGFRRFKMCFRRFKNGV